MRFNEKIKKAKELIKNVLDSNSNKDVVVAWTGGKDSTVLLHLIQQVSNNKIPIRVFFNDSGYEFPEVEKFISKLKEDWKLELIRFKHSRVFREKIKLKPTSLLFRQAKIDSIKRAVKKYRIKIFISGIRRDEHPTRATEKYISQKEDHARVHPILDFTEDEIWKYIKKYNVPYVSLYDKGYRSLGERLFTRVVKKGDKERSGRDSEKEKIMDKLRSLGYW